jgi:hypothetical protein
LKKFNGNVRLKKPRSKSQSRGFTHLKKKRFLYEYQKRQNPSLEMTVRKSYNQKFAQSSRKARARHFLKPSPQKSDKKAVKRALKLEIRPFGRLKIDEEPKKARKEAQSVPR